MKKKRRSDISKLVTRAREVWRQSETYYLAKMLTKSKRKYGWFTCKCCGEDREVIKIDHIKPIGKQPDTFKEFGPWLEKLFCPIDNLQGLDADCHKKKTQEDNKILKKVISVEVI